MEALNLKPLFDLEALVAVGVVVMVAVGVRLGVAVGRCARWSIASTAQTC